MENLDIDEHRNTIDDIETLANNTTSSDITDPVLMLLKSTNIIRVLKIKHFMDRKDLRFWFNFKTITAAMNPPPPPAFKKGSCGVRFS